MNIISDDEAIELKIYKDVANDIKRRFREYEIDALIKIYRWTKSERNTYFFTHILKRIPNYTRAIKKLKSERLITLVKSKDPHRITQDGIRVGRLLLTLKNLDLL